MPPNLYNQARNMIPKFPESAATNQDVMHVLAEGTGGFVIINTNDLLSGFEKIGKEMNEYYLLGYEPPESNEGSCHTLRVKVDRSGLNVRARTGYCNARPRDLVAKNPVEKTLENRAASAQAGDVSASMQTPFFYTAPNQARVNVAMDIAPKAMKFEKQKGKLHSELDILGIAYKPDGSVAARFGDAVKLDFENKKEADAFSESRITTRISSTSYRDSTVSKWSSVLAGKVSEKSKSRWPWIPMMGRSSASAASRSATTTGLPLAWARSWMPC